MIKPTKGLLVKVDLYWTVQRPEYKNIVGELLRASQQSQNVWEIWWPQLNKNDFWWLGNLELYNNGKS